MDEGLRTIRDVAGQTQWWPGTHSSGVVATDDEGRIAPAATQVADVKVAKDSVEVDCEHTDERTTWRRSGPGKARKPRSDSWALVDRDGEIEVTLSLAVESSLPHPGVVQRKVVVDAVKGATEGLTKHLGG
jgi:hypothetical protein